MKNLFDATVANQVKARLGKLEPQSERRWGKMTAAQMLAYCSVSMQWAVGEVVPEKGSATRTSDGAAGEADGVSERRLFTEEFADSKEPDCDGRTRLGQGTGAVIGID